MNPPDVSLSPVTESGEATRAAFVAAVGAAIDAGEFESLVLAKTRHPGDDLRAVRVRRIGLRGTAALSLVYSHATRDVTRNLPRDEGLAAIAALLDPAATPSFGHATLRTSAAETQLLVSRKGRSTVRRKPHADRPRRAPTLPPCPRTIASASAGCRPTCRS